MKVDCAFNKGFSHDICQDYTTIYNPDEYIQMILCDGCSSSENTDFGARILANIFSNRLFNFNEKQIINILKLISSEFNLDYSFLDSTLLTAFYENNKIILRYWGDGFIIQKYKNYYNIQEINYENNYPFYFSYLLDGKKFENYKKINKECKFKLIETIIDNQFLEKNIEIQFYNYKDCYSLINVSDDFEYIAFISDGLNSFIEKKQTQTFKLNKSIDKIEILKKLLIFKNYNGRFVQRRLNFFKKECEQLGWDHYDDLSIAVMVNK